ncbi:nicotinamidase-related amidase [Actinocorallia herbida]|uniref:Nicotinamidase-related amidase n=1 Tax=Actinocorallia herbida TaxID=58109 RepID=A0A3N1CQM0_9ACTN|nr:cysteine hydrolase family protein [Actinocorallia herbida]ROO83505.1 nicotinamidase-related amidase [Actinocorallia herbida]
MPLDLSELAAPGSTAVLVMEMQRGVLGDIARFPGLREICAERGTVAATARVLAAARAAGVPVIQCTAAFRADRAGSHTTNTPFLRNLLRDPAHMLEGTPAIEVLPELAAAGDLENRRYHGFTPFTGTTLDQVLRSLGVTTVVGVGVSLNLAIPGLCSEAVALGYRVVVPVDAVAGIPAEHGDAVLAHTISLLATRTTADDLAKAWSPTDGAAP